MAGTQARLQRIHFQPAFRFADIAMKWNIHSTPTLDLKQTQSVT